MIKITGLGRISTRIGTSLWEINKRNKLASKKTILYKKSKRAGLFKWQEKSFTKDLKNSIKDKRS